MIDVVATIWIIFLFVVCFFAYLSFSVISRDALNTITLPLERRKEPFELSPLSRLTIDANKLLMMLQFSRLLFIVPVLLFIYKWTAPISGILVTAVLVGVVLLLYILPDWLYYKNILWLFRGAVQLISYILYPVFWIMAKLSPEPKKEEAPKEEGKKNGEEEHEQSQEFKGDILKAMSMIEDTTVREVMTPRVDMVSIAATASLEELHQFFKEHKFSRLPVYGDKIDNIAGIVSVMDLVSTMPTSDGDSRVSTIMRPALFVPETKKVFTLLREFRESHAQMAIVIDEYGGTSGLVTLEDLLEEIVGEIEDEYDEAPFESYQEREGSYIVTGKFPVERLEEMFQMEISGEDFETISGLIFSVVGRIPVVGEVIGYKNLNMEILEADKRRIHRVRITQVEEKKDEEEPV
jgi:putative hemolysin